ncbi:MAG: 50S ribosomal protein L21 [Bacteroidota bacterium]
MYAIVDIAGQQFKVENGNEIFVHRLEGEPGAKMEFEKVMLTAENDKIKIGEPFLTTKVSATIIEHLRGDKVLVFKKKKRKGYRTLNGHRQDLTKIKIENIK